MSAIKSLATLPLRVRGVTVGRDTYVSPGSAVREPRRVFLGQHCSIGRNVELHPQGGEIRIGNDCSLRNGCIVYGAGGITIGDDCRIANGVSIVAFNHVFDDPEVPIRTQGITRRGIVIGDDVWIGTRAVILDGVTLGRGSVVGAGAVVTRSFPDRSIIAGVPARTVGER